MVLGFPGTEHPALEIAVFALAVLWDLCLGEAKVLHPVKGMGRLVSFLERSAPTQGKARPFLYGLAMAILIPGAFGLAVYLVSQALLPLSAIAYVVIGAYILKSSFAVRELDRAALRVCRSLEGEEWPRARQELRSLVGRDTSSLDADLLASATVESVAENTSDSFVAPWLFFSFLGLPGAIAYRAINTLDSMIGYRQRYEYLGKAAARLDDLANLIPARLAAVFIVLAARLRGRGASRAWLTMWRDHRLTESPNAGWTMSAMAGALGVELQKVGHYRLGDPLHPIGPPKVREAVDLARWVAALSLLLTLGLLVARYGILAA